MAIQAGLLLKRLEPSVRPMGTGASPTARQPFESLDFGEMMTLVSRGEVRSDRVVSLAFASEEPLSEAQLKRLASAADLAEAEGAQRAVMLIDGRGVVMDVPQRAIVHELSRGSTALVRDVDAAVFVADPEAEDGGAGRLIPGTGLPWSTPPDPGEP